MSYSHLDLASDEDMSEQHSTDTKACMQMPISWSCMMWCQHRQGSGALVTDQEEEQSSHTPELQQSACM